MTKSKFVEFFKRFDEEKFSLMQHGVAFDLIVRDRDHGTYMHTGIGDNADMSQMILFSILSLYTTLDQNKAFTKEVTIEAFADNIKELAIKAYKDDIFHLRGFDGGAAGQVIPME